METPIPSSTTPTPATTICRTLYPPVPIPGNLTLIFIQNENELARAQMADQSRLPIDWPKSGRKLGHDFTPIATGKWWYAWAQETSYGHAMISHVSRIMETEIGMQLFGNERCGRCQQEGLECWIYSPQYLHRVKHVGTTVLAAGLCPFNTDVALPVDDVGKAHSFWFQSGHGRFYPKHQMGLVLKLRRLVQ